MIPMEEKPARGRLTLVCTETGKEVDTGVVYTRDDLERAKPAKLLLRCRHCGKSHIFKFSDARLNSGQHHDCDFASS
jgi:ribosomal protein L33